MSPDPTLEAATARAQAASALAGAAFGHSAPADPPQQPLLDRQDRARAALLGLTIAIVLLALSAALGSLLTLALFGYPG